MKVKDLTQMDICIDVYDDVCNEIAVCFDGPLALTDEGSEKFAEVLEYDVELVDPDDDHFAYALVKIYDKDDAVWERRLEKAKEFFWAAAGYCSEDNYDKWFKE